LSFVFIIRRSDQVRRGFLSVGYGSGVQPAQLNWAQPKQTAREIPRRIERCYSRQRPGVKEFWAKMARK
jgi:hypothetical protein